MEDFTLEAARASLQKRLTPERWERYDKFSFVDGSTVSSFAISFKDNDYIQDAMMLAIGLIEQIPGWENQLLRKYGFTICPHDTQYGQSDPNGLLIVSRVEEK